MKPIFKVKKAGKLANGFERGKGSVVHLTCSSPHLGSAALCGDRPKIQWVELEDSKEVTCKKCVKLFLNLNE